MKTDWTKGFSDADKDSFYLLLKGSTIVLNRLESLIKEYHLSVLSKELKEEEFDTPNWAYKQAYRNGQQAAYNKILQLLKD